jgi:hypothetical protein
MVELATYKLNVNYSFPQLACQAKKQNIARYE